MLKPVTLIAAALALAISPAAAQSAGDYPNKPVRVLVTVPPGGGVDTVTRLVTGRMAAKLGQTFVVENRGGAGGSIAAEAVYKAEPDGYQLMASQPSPITTNVALYKSLNYDPTKFQFVGIMSMIPNVLLVKNTFPAKTAKEFIDYVKANPGKVNYASQGPGTTSHLTAELYNKLTGSKTTHVPYKGTGPALNDLVSGQFDYMVDQAVNVLPQIKGGNIKALGVSTLKRLPQLPDVPTIDESGLKGYEVTIWNGFFVAKGTPKNVIDTLNKALVTALSDEKVRARLIEQAVDLPEAKDATPEALAAQLKASIDKWVPAIKAAGVQPQ
jgi:tripartite-type tricarboxylate transporter receptor subunit TctC